MRFYVYVKARGAGCGFDGIIAEFNAYIQAVHFRLRYQSMHPGARVVIGCK